MGFDAFISYRRENGFLMAQVIRDRLRDRGISCFLDLEEDKSGKFDENLLSAIAGAPNFILILPKNALTRCKDPEDWVRREILAAVSGGKTIIPVMYDGFVWPKKWDGIPEEIQQLKTHQGVSMSKEYLSAMIDKIIHYMTGLGPDLPASGGKAGDPMITRDSVDFFSLLLTNSESVDNVCMAFHAGADWRQDSGKLQLLQTMLKNHVKLRVLLNDSKTAEYVCRHMQQPLKKYVGFDTCLADWKELEAMYPDVIQVRVCPLAMLHRIYLLRKKDGSGQVSLKYYTYGNYKPSRDCRATFHSRQMEYALYCEEFDYLWDISSP